MRIVVLLVVVVMVLGNQVYAQDPTSIPLSAEQTELLTLLETAHADQATWQSYRVVSFNSLFYSETLTISFGNTISSQRTTNSTVTTIYSGNPRVGNYNSDSLMTIENIEQNFFSSGQQTTENYVLTVNARYFGGQLYVQALRDGGSAELPPMPALSWLDITANPDQYAALRSANLRRYLPNASAPLAPHPLLDVDFIALVHNTPLRELVANIEQVAEGEVLNNGVITRQIRVQLNPVAVLSLIDNNNNLVDALANEGVDMALIVWLDATTSRRVREQFVFVLQGSPDPLAFGYAPGEIEESGGLMVLFQLESDISYLDVNVPVEISAPLE